MYFILLEKSPTLKANSLVHSSVITDMLEKDEIFKPTPEVITNAMITNHLDSFIKPISSLTILETLGEGKVTPCSSVLFTVNR